MVIGSLSLMAFPFLTGFYSKDLILELAWASFSFHGTFAHWLGTIAASLTAFYSFRLLFLAFVNTPNSSNTAFYHSHEPSISMLFPLSFLALSSIFFGFLFKDLFLGLGSPFFTSLLDSEFLPSSIKLLPLFFSLWGLFLATFYLSPRATFPRRTALHSFLSSSWHFDFIYNSTFAKPLLTFGLLIPYKTLDRGLWESVGPSGLSSLFFSSSRFLSSFHSGFLFHSAFVLFSATTFFFLLSPYLLFLSTTGLFFFLPLLILFF